ncbi:MAG: T9SS type A sorting domain-containing protein [Saprospiraceae bacterium]|nr:T9SS type A sorting domain-containing protein [Saprospiraceae bacterium]
MKRTILLVFLFFISLHSVVQGQVNIEWQSNFGGSNSDLAFSVDATTDGGVIVVGFSNSQDGDITDPLGDYDFWVVKVDVNGHMEWQKSLGGMLWDEAQSVKQTMDGGYIVAGNTLSVDGDVSEAFGEHDYWVVKLSPLGEIEWERSYGGSEEDMAYGIDQTSDQGYIVAGRAYSEDGDISNHIGGLDYWVLRLDADGEILWENSYGGNNWDWAYGVDLTQDGGFILGGVTKSTAGDVPDFHGGFDFLLIKIDADGVVQWSNNFGGSDTDVATGVKAAPDGGYVISGNTYSDDIDVSNLSGGIDFWIVKTDKDGVMEWERSLGGSGDESAKTLALCSDGSILVAGSANSNDGDLEGTDGSGSWIVKLDQDGDIIWEQEFYKVGVSIITDIVETMDKGIVFVDRSYNVIKLTEETSSIPDQANPMNGGFRIFPNPSQDFIYLELKDPSLLGQSYQIFNLIGEKIQVGWINQLTQNIQISEFSNGQYYLQIENQKSHKMIYFTKS